MASKSGLREEFLRKRRSLLGPTVTSKSDQIFRNVIKLKELNLAQNFLVYLPVNKEVDTKHLIEYLLSQKSGIFVPAFSKSSNTYKVARFTGFDNLIEGPYRIPQPKNIEEVDINLIDVDLIPGLGFDRRGVRLGYGKGVYDKLLGASRASRLALAYDFQVVNRIPKEKHDLVVDMIITESRIYEIT